MYAMVMLFNGWSEEPKSPSLNNPWKGHPYNARKNVNGINGDPEGTGSGVASQTLVDPRVTRLQETYIRRVVDAVGDQSNVLFEISNESRARSIDWQNHMVAVIRAYEQRRSLRHPVGISAEWPDGHNSDLLAGPAQWIAPNGSIDDPAPADGGNSSPRARCRAGQGGIRATARHADREPAHGRGLRGRKPATTGACRRRRARGGGIRAAAPTAGSGARRRRAAAAAALDRLGSRRQPAHLLFVLPQGCPGDGSRDFLEPFCGIS